MTLCHSAEYKYGMDGGKLLGRWMTAKGWRQADLVRETGIDDSLISRWLSGAKVPPLRHAVAIQKLTGGKVPASSWV